MDERIIEQFRNINGVNEYDKILQAYLDRGYKFKVVIEFIPTSSSSGHWGPVVYKRRPGGEWIKDESKDLSFAVKILKSGH